MLDTCELHYLVDRGQRSSQNLGPSFGTFVVVLSVATETKCPVLIDEAGSLSEVAQEQRMDRSTHSLSKCTRSSFTYGAIYVQLTAEASAACSIQNMVVAKVAMPCASSASHAWRPSHVAGILMQSRFESAAGTRALKIKRIPMEVSVHLLVTL